VKSYTVLLGAMMTILVILLITRKDFETTIIRQRGTTYQLTNDGRVSNIYEINLTNKTNKNYVVTLKLDDPDGEIEMVVDKFKLKKEFYLKERFIIKLPMEKIDHGKTILHVQIIGNGKVIETVKTKFIGPML